MQTNNQNSNSPINPKLGSSVTNAIKNAEAGELPALDDISNITNRVVEKIKASENILIALSEYRWNFRRARSCHDSWHYA